MWDMIPSILKRNIYAYLCTYAKNTQKTHQTPSQGRKTPVYRVQ